MTDHRCTYSPDDNKIRIYPAYRLDKEDYERVRATGFKWAPRQELFVAPMWTPDREDIAIEFCGEIEDEDTSLVDRAEERAERFEEYSEKRAADANSAHAAVDAIAGNIPFGQPILVGHHSERHARKHAQQIENGMRKAVNMWETSKYWQQRAQGALRHAKYKERADVRHRRIKGLEADLRRCVAAYTPVDGVPEIMQQEWLGNGEYGPEVPHVYVGPKGRGGHWVAKHNLENIKEHYSRWENHYQNRIMYERAMLDEQGGLKADGFDFQVGGQVLHKWGWNIISRINKKDGVILSLSLINNQYPTKVDIEDVKDYRPPTEEASKSVKAVMKLPPMCNFPGEGFAQMTKADWKGVYSDHKSSVAVKATETIGAHRIREVQAFIGRKFGGNAGSDYKNQRGSILVYITDEKRKDPPKLEAKLFDVPAPAPKLPEIERKIPNRPKYVEPERTVFDDLKDTLKAGVTVVSAPQLFPTPPELAEKMVDAAGLEPGLCVLEPSAGTGNLIKAVLDRVDTEVLAYEINWSLCNELSKIFPDHKVQVRQADFLEVTDFMGCYPRIIMNPPFAQGQDIKHILHAIKFLAPGGRLVALCANGPRQCEKLKPLAEDSGGYWEDLPAGSFKAEGTGANVAMIVIEN